MKILSAVTDCLLRLIIILLPLILLSRIDKLEAKILQSQVIIYQVDSAGGMLAGSVTEKAIIDGHYTVTIGSHGKFLVSREQYEAIKIGDEVPDYLRGGMIASE